MNRLQLEQPKDGYNQYLSLLKHVRDNGKPATPRGMPVLQIGTHTVILPMRRLVARDFFNVPLAIVEGANLVRGFTDVNAIEAVAPRTAEKFYRTNKMSYYAERLDTEQTLRRLREDPHSRKAISYFGRTSDYLDDTRCMAYVQFQNVDILNMHVALRSWDLYLGLPYDVAMTQIYAAFVAKALDAVPGCSYYLCSNPHLYKKHAPKVEECNAQDWQWVELDLPAGRDWRFYQEAAEEVARKPLESGLLKLGA